METKQVIVIRKDLKMRRGKEIAQGSHASMAFITKRMQKCLDATNTAYAHTNEAERAWIRSSFRKIVCKVPDLESLMQIAEKAKEAGLETHVIEDSGYTEFDGVPTVTALAIGPDWDDKIDPITKDLVLY